MHYREFVCEYCGKNVKQKVKHKWQAQQKRRFCSHSCSAKASAAQRRASRIDDGWIPPKPRKPRPKPPFYREYVCEYCGEHVKEEVKAHYLIRQPKRFCSRACTNKWKHETGVINVKGVKNHMYCRTLLDCWIDKYGPEKANELEQLRRDKLSVSMSKDGNPMFGRTHTVDARQKISDFRSGKTIEELWGVKRAKTYRQELSARMSGSGNPMFGKTSSGGRSIKGTYKGFFFRSLLEYSYMKHLESQGFDLDDVEYETVRIHVNESMTYKPNFFIPSTKTLVEVKPAYATQSEKNLIKFEAARYYCNEKGWNFVVMTENDFPKISFADAQQDPDIIFDERTFEYFLRT